VPCDFRLALRETRDMLEVSLPSTVELSTEIPDQPVTVTASLAELGQIAMNLCVNARDALEGEPGSIDLALRIGLAGDYVETDDTSSAELANAFTISEIGCGRSRLTAGALAAEQPVAVLTVEDSGKGMDRETLQRVFEPFFSTKGHGRGTGLGLAAVFGIVTGNGGALVVETAPGRGCRFDIIWPLSDVPARSEADQAPDAERGSGRIMIVDDEPMVLDSTAQALVRLGYEVDTLNSPVEAAEILLASWECYDLLLFDQTMPEMTGLMVIDTLHQAGADLPIFLYSGHDPELEDLDPAAHGVQGVFGKPLDMKRFSQAIKQVLS